MISPEKMAGFVEYTMRPLTEDVKEIVKALEKIGPPFTKDIIYEVAGKIALVHLACRIIEYASYIAITYIVCSTVIHVL